MKSNNLKKDAVKLITNQSNVAAYLDDTVSRGTNLTYLTTKELSEKIKYDTKTIRDRLKDSVLFEGVHYLHPFGGRKILYIWEQIEKDMFTTVKDIISIPMADGGVCNG